MKLYNEITYAAVTTLQKLLFYTKSIYIVVYFVTFCLILNLELNYLIYFKIIHITLNQFCGLKIFSAAISFISKVIRAKVADLYCARIRAL